MNKKAAIPILVIIIIAVFVTGVASTIIINKMFFSSDDADKKDGVFNPGFFSEDSSDSPDSSTQPTQADSSTTSVSSVAGGGGGGGTGSSGGGGEDSSSGSGEIPMICTISPITYSLTTVNHSFECKDYSGDICIKQDVYCSDLIKNRDIVPTGFEIELVFVEDGKEKETDGFEITMFNKSLNPGQASIIYKSFTLESLGEDGIANQKINCFFNTLNNPLKETCVPAY